MKNVDLKIWKVVARDVFAVSAFVYLVLAWFEFNSPGSVNEYFDHQWLLAIMILGLFACFAKPQLIKENHLKFFAASVALLFLSGFSFAEQFLPGLHGKMQAAFFILSVSFGSITLWSGRKKIQETVGNGSSVKTVGVCKNGLIKLAKSKNWKYEIGFACLVALLFTMTISLWGDFIGGDEWHMYNLAKTIVETGSLETEWNFFYNQPDFSYEHETFPSIHLALWFKIFGESIPVAHLSSFMVATLLIISAFLLAKSVFNKQTGLLLAVLIATNPFFVWHSIYIRGYIYLLLFSLWACWLLLLIGMEKNFKKIIFYLVLFFILLLLMKDIRVFSVVLIVPLVMILAYRIYARYRELIPQKTKNLLLFILALSAVSFFLVIPKIKELLPYYGDGFKQELGFSFFALELGFFTFPLLVSIAIIFSVAIFSFLGSKKGADENFKRFSRKYFLLLAVWGLVNFIYCYFSNENLLIPRYLATIIPLNMLILVGAGYFFLLSIFKENKKALIAGILLVALANGFFWTTSNLHGWSSGYNFTDIYMDGKYTAQGRIPEKTEIMYEILDKYFSQHQPEKVALLTEYYLDPRMKALSKWRETVNLIALRRIAYDTKLVENIFENYQKFEGSPIKKEYLEKIMGVYDSTIIVFQTRKAYKFTEQLKYVEELGFQKLSGAGVDESGIEIFLKEK